jgi:hypothetical protein
MTGTGGAIGAQLAGEDTADDEPLERPESAAGISLGPADTPGIDEPVGPTEAAGPNDPDA